VQHERELEAERDRRARELKELRQEHQVPIIIVNETSDQGGQMCL
jgi:hypothetical protein